ncbi:MAG: MmcQ/YjbR family DNA-binding protein [Prevotellaceae bacterium]|jgi:predicted DNA-binding protein (MmcQ/YjbR family)|nr:MmcQ/YjbR family DNA-binding protein [Prevotellaceae bacterium]
MNIEEFRKHCLLVKGAEESISLQNRNVMVCKVMEKVFVYLPLAPEDGVFRAYLKCEPERTIALREKYKGVTPDKFKTLMWSWVALESDVPNELIEELIRHSADEVIKKLPKYKQAQLNNE